MSDRTPRPRRTPALATALSIALLSLTPIAIAQPDADRSYRSATGLLNRGMHELAAEEYRAFLKDHPDHPQATTARYGLAVCLSRLGRNDEAAKELAQVVTARSFEFAPDALLLRGQCLLLAGDPESATTDLARFRKAYPDHAQANAALALLGEAQFRTGKHAEACETFSRLPATQASDPHSARSFLLWGMSELALGRAKDAAARMASLRAADPAGPYAPHATLVEAQCRHRLGETAPALALYRSAAASKDPSVRFDAQLGESQLTRADGKPAEARVMLERLLKSEAGASTIASARLELGRCLLDEGRPEDAIAQLETLRTSATPDLADDIEYWTARCEGKLGRHAADAARLATCEERFPDSDLLPDMMYERAAALGLAGETEEAEAAFAALREKFPKHDLAADAALGEASSAFQAGDDATARRLCAAFLADHPSHPQASSAALLLAECDYRSGDFTRAERGYAAFLEKYGSDANAWRAAVRRGLALMRLGKAEEATALLDRALAEPGAGDRGTRLAALVTRADAAFARADWETSQRRFDEAARLTDHPADADTTRVREDSLLKLGLSMHRRGAPADAIAAYDRLLTESPDGRHALQATFEKGQALAELKRDAEAAAAFNQVVAAEKDAAEPRFSAHALRHLAAIASRAGRAEEAAALLAQIGDLTGEGSAAIDLERGRALLSAGKYADAEEALTQAIDASTEPAIALEARAHRAIAVSRQGRSEDALMELTSLKPRSSDLPAESRASVAYELASVLKQLGRDDEAAAAYQDLLALGPPPSLAAYAAIDLAQLSAKSERFDDCLRWVDAAAASVAKTDRGTLQAITDHGAYLRGISEHRLGRSADAAKTLSRFLSDRADSPLREPAALACGEAMIKSGHPADAAKILGPLASASTDAQIAGPALLRLGESHALAQQWTASEEAFTTYLSRFGDSGLWFQARFGIGWARENQGRHEAAIESYREVVERHSGPTAARAQFQIGECLYATKKLDAAVRELMRVDILYAYPEWSAAALFEAGRCLAEQGKTGDAREQFEQVIKRFADTNWARLAAEEIKKARPAALPGRRERAGTADAK